MPSFVAPVGLPSVTTAERDALTGTDGMLVWNSDDNQVQRFGDYDWKPVPITDEVNEIFGVLAVDLGRIRAALRFLGVEPELFDPQIY